MDRNKNDIKKKPIFQEKKIQTPKILINNAQNRVQTDNKTLVVLLQEQKKKFQRQKQKLMILKAQESKFMEDRHRYKFKLEKMQRQLQQMRKNIGNPMYFVQNNDFLSQYLQQMVLQKSAQEAFQQNQSNPNDPDRMTYQQLLELGQKIGKVSKGLTIQQLEKLKRVVFIKSKSTQQCSVCCYEFKNNQKLIKLPCNHYYHQECIIGWLKEQKICPLCKAYVI